MATLSQFRGRAEPYRTPTLWTTGRCAVDGRFFLEQEYARAELQKYL